MSEKKPNRKIGDMPCPLCAAPVAIRLSAKGMFYYVCDHTAGGCGHQDFARFPAAEKLIARRITKWVDPTERRAYLGDEALPVKARPAPSPEPEPEPEPELVDPDDPLDPEPEPEPMPTPPARRAPPRRASPPPPSTKKENPWGLP